MNYFFGIFLLITILLSSCYLPTDTDNTIIDSENDSTTEQLDTEASNICPDVRFVGVWKNATYFQDIYLGDIKSNIDYLSFSSSNNISWEFLIHENPSYLNNSDYPLKYIWGIENNQFFKRLYTVETDNRKYYDFSFVDNNHLILTSDSNSKHYFLELPSFPSFSVIDYEYHQGVTDYIVCTGIIENTGDFSALGKIVGNCNGSTNPIYTAESSFDIAGKSVTDFSFIFNNADANNVYFISFEVYFTRAYYD